MCAQWKSAFYNLIWSDNPSLLHILFVIGPAHTWQEGMTPGCQYQEVGIMEGRLRKQATTSCQGSRNKAFLDLRAQSCVLYIVGLQPMFVERRTHFCKTCSNQLLCIINFNH